MRFVALVSAVALGIAGPAAASSSPPPTPPDVLHAIKLVRTHAPSDTRACMARLERAKVARWLAPVACEQPPRSQPLLTTALFG